LGAKKFSAASAAYGWLTILAMDALGAFYFESPSSRWRGVSQQTQAGLHLDVSVAPERQSVGAPLAKLGKPFGPRGGLFGVLGFDGSGRVSAKLET
jgi:hypothetical protein